jgi:sugar lactone lactonase YvrE
MKTLFAVFCLPVLLAAQAPNLYPLGPDSQVKADVPKGVVTRLKLAPGNYYPGTPHDYAIYVPAQYNAARPTPFMIYLDGIGALGNQQRVPIVFDNLIAKGDIPPMIGIFINPGVLPALSDKAQNRYERIFEYDSINDRFAEFLINEVIPEVGKSYNLSKDPNDRGLSGVSTGAVGAFMAAWSRPDQFRRVLSFIGTFVAMRGADTLPALIRRTEPKPIRVHLQAGKNDHTVPGQPYGTFYAGSWPINNQVMFEALTFAGYDTKFVLGDEGHNMVQGSQIMPDALRWLWRGYPAPITANEPPAMGQPGWDARGQVSAIVTPSKPWQEITGTYKAPASPTTGKDGMVYFADPDANRIYKIDDAGAVSVFKEGTFGARALRAGADGRIYASQPARKRIVSYGPAGDEKTVAPNVEANDLIVSAEGAIYFVTTATKTVGLIDSKGARKIAYQSTDIYKPTSLAFTPDQAYVIVGDGETRYSWSFQVAADGTLINGEPYFRLEMPDRTPYSEVRGITTDATGQVFFATAIGIQVSEPVGRSTQLLHKPEAGTLTSVNFGGKDNSWLYATVGSKIFRRPTKRTGVNAWAPVKPPQPPL